MPSSSRSSSHLSHERKMSANLFTRSKSPQKKPRVIEDDTAKEAVVCLNDEKSDQVEPTESEHLLEYHRSFLSLGYFSLITPFRLARTRKNGPLEFYQFRPQQVLCAIIHIFIMHEYVASVRINLMENFDGSPMSYVNVVTSVASLFYVLFFIYVFWARRKAFKRMLEEIQNLKFTRNVGRYTHLKARLLSTCLCGFSVAVAFTDPIIHDGLLVHNSIYETYKIFSCRARSYYLFQECHNHGPASILPPNETILATMATLVHLLVYIPNLIMVHIIDVVVVLTALCMWNVLREFTKQSKQATTSAEQALIHYENLRQLVQHMNSAMGLLTFSAIAISLPFYASWGAIAFNNDSGDRLYLIHFCHFTINFLAILAFGADFNFKVGEFYSRVFVPAICEQISPNRLYSLLTDMYSNQISMRGCGFFVMSYRFCGTILSLIITYTVIILQFQFSPRNSGQVNCTFSEVHNFTTTITPFTRTLLT